MVHPWIGGDGTIARRERIYSRARPRRDWTSSVSRYVVYHSIRRWPRRIARSAQRARLTYDFEVTLPRYSAPRRRRNARSPRRPQVTPGTISNSPATQWPSTAAVGSETRRGWTRVTPSSPRGPSPPGPRQPRAPRSPRSGRVHRRSLRTAFRRSAAPRPSTDRVAPFDPLDSHGWDRSPTLVLHYTSHSRADTAHGTGVDATAVPGREEAVVPRYRTRSPERGERSINRMLRYRIESGPLDHLVPAGPLREATGRVSSGTAHEQRLCRASS